MKLSDMTDDQLYAEIARINRSRRLMHRIILFALVFKITILTTLLVIYRG